MNLLDVLLLSGGGEDEEGEDNGGGCAGGALHGDRLGELKGALDRRLALNTGTANREGWNCTDMSKKSNDRLRDPA